MTHFPTPLSLLYPQLFYPECSTYAAGTWLVFYAEKMGRNIHPPSSSLPTSIISDEYKTSSGINTYTLHWHDTGGQIWNPTSTKLSSSIFSTFNFGEEG